MPTRNTPVLQSVIETLGDQIARPKIALATLEEHFGSVLVTIAGDTNDVARHAEKLRLAITQSERGKVLDHIGHTRVAELTIDHVEEAINTLFPDRFIEP